MADSKSQNVSTGFRVVPFAIAFPLLIIAFNGCWEGGCQGALNAQSYAVRQALKYGGWIKTEPAPQDHRRAHPSSLAENR